MYSQKDKTTKCDYCGAVIEKKERRGSFAISRYMARQMIESRIHICQKCLPMIESKIMDLVI